MNRLNKTNQSVLDHSFSSFVLGLTLGAFGVILIGTKEGRNFVKKTLGSITEDLDIKENIISKIKSPITSVSHQKTPTSKISPFPRQTIFQEPPPVPPVSHQSQYFRNNTDDTSQRRP